MEIILDVIAWIVIVLFFIGMILIIVKVYRDDQCIKQEWKEVDYDYNKE